MVIFEFILYNKLYNFVITQFGLNRKTLLGLDRSPLDMQGTGHEPINCQPSRTFASFCPRVYTQNRLVGVASSGDGQGAMGAVGL